MKSLKYSLAILMLSSAAIAQQSTTPNEFVLRVKPNDVSVIGKALGKLPFDEVAELIQSLRNQIIEQSTSKAVEPKSETSKEPDK